MDAFAFGKYISNSRGLQRAVTGVPAIYRGQGVVNAAQFLGGALSPVAEVAGLYNPYIQAALIAPTVWQGAKWLVDQL